MLRAPGKTTSTACTYTVGSIGRTTLTGGNCGATPSIFYLNSLNSAFVLGGDPTVEVGAFEPVTPSLSKNNSPGRHLLRWHIGNRQPTGAG